MSDEDFALKVKVQNGLLHKAILDKYPNVAQFCKEHNLSQSIVGGFLNFKALPTIKDGTSWAKHAENLADALGVEPEDIFPDRLVMVLPTNEAVRYIDGDAIMALIADGPEKSLEVRDMAEKLLECLSPKEKHVIRETVMDCVPDGEIASAFHVSANRVHQIREKALHKLRIKVVKLRAP